MKIFAVALAACAYISSASAQAASSGQTSTGSDLVLHFALAASDASEAKAGEPYFEPGTGYLSIGGLVMLGGVAVVFGGIGLSIVSQPSPPPNPFFANFSPADGYLVAVGGGVIIGVGVFLVWLGLERRAEAHRPSYSWSVLPGYDPVNRVPVVSLSRMW